MKVFLKYILSLVLFVVITMFLLESAYSYVGKNCAPRTKTDLLMNWPDGKKIDYAIVGSSRAAMHLDPKIILKKTGASGFNFGVNGSELFENKLSVQTIIKKKVTEVIYLQIDDNHNDEEANSANSSYWLPYLGSKYIYDSFSKLNNNDNYYMLKQVPFLKYLKYDSRIGFREKILALQGKENKTFKSYGFEGGNGVVNEGLNKSYSLNNKSNQHLLDIISMCERNNVELVLFTAPIYNFKGSHDLLKKYPNYYDYSMNFKNHILFKDLMHLNDTGAEKFTNFIIDKHFQNNY